MHNSTSRFRISAHIPYVLPWKEKYLTLYYANTNPRNCSPDSRSGDGAARGKAAGGKRGFGAMSVTHVTSLITVLLTNMLLVASGFCWQPSIKVLHNAVSRVCVVCTKRIVSYFMKPDLIQQRLHVVAKLVLVAMLLQLESKAVSNFFRCGLMH